MAGAMWSTEANDRADGWGRFLRITRIDELPQLINILKGEMSFIGPRPDRPEFMEKFKRDGVPGYTCRHLVRPGLMGYAQVLNPNLTMEEVHQRNAWDLYYLQNWSPRLDFWIIKRTCAYVWPTIVYIFSKRISRYPATILPTGTQENYTANFPHSAPG